MTFQATVLYIEDDEACRVLVERVLTYAGYRVLIASRALDGIDMARKHRPDLILTDVNLPDLSGREIAIRLRSDPQLKTVPIVALTRQSAEHGKTFVAGVTGYITKPIDVHTFTDQIEDFLRGRRDDIDAVTLEPARYAYDEELVEQLESNVRQLETSYRDLRRIDQIKDDFIQLTAHELRTPLTTVYGYSRLVQTSSAIQRIMAQDPEVRACLKGLVDSIERLHSVMNEIITVARIASGRLDLRVGPTNLRGVIQSVVESYNQVTSQRALTIEFIPEEWPTIMLADEGLLELAFSNVFGNAIKYTPDGGTIALHAYTSEDAVHISVQDTGIGIDPVDQIYIFDRFYTAGDTQLHSTSKTAFRGGGLGLGLAICKGIIEEHGGHIWVESPGCDPDNLPGSTFFIVLPLNQPADYAPPDERDVYA